MIPSRLKYIRKAFSGKEFNLLDVGSGNHSVTEAKKYFRNCHYFGIDITRNYNCDPKEFEQMDGFWEMDLTRLEFDAIPDHFFDAILMAHIIEHLPNGDRVMTALTAKLNPGGYIYLEFPSARSVKFPSRRGTLNFYDDPTHVRIYSHREVSELLRREGFDILSFGTRRDWRNIILLPVKVFHNIVKYGYVMGSVYWDIYGFAEYVWAQKRTTAEK